MSSTKRNPVPPLQPNDRAPRMHPFGQCASRVELHLQLATSILADEFGILAHGLALAALLGLSTVSKVEIKCCAAFFVEFACQGKIRSGLNVGAHPGPTSNL